MELKETIKSFPFLKKLAFWLLMPVGQAKPRLWVKLFVHPFSMKRGRRSVICSSSRMDVFPFNRFCLGSNSTIEDFCTVNNGSGNVSIGSNTRIGVGSVLIGPVNIGEDVRLAQNVVVTALNHNYKDVSRPISEQGVNTEEIYIGDETWIGANAVILPGVFIGKHCVVAAGSVVTKSIPSNSLVAGNPAKIIKQYKPETDQWERVVS